MIRFFTFSQFHKKNPPAGSTFIRVNQLIKYWPEADLYKYGENPDVLIFQKVYVSQDYKFPVHFKNKKILDICDPDWLDGKTAIKETIDAMDAITCPTKALADFLSQMTDKPVVVIPDRWDIEIIPKPKKHKGKAKTVVWYGYAHNAETVRPAIDLINKHDLELLIISNDNPLYNRYAKKYKFIKSTEQNTSEFYDLMQQADFAILPSGNRPIDIFKSNNKDTKAILAGLPIVKDLDSFERYLDGEERQGFVDNEWKSVRDMYDVRNSVNEYKDLISKL